jgi:tyrosyl-tRNA synthetase
MEMYYTLLTDLPPAEFRGQIASDPRGAKVRLAKHLIAWLHSPEAAETAEAEWNRLFPSGSKGKAEAVPDDIVDVPVTWPSKLAPALAKAALAASNGEATRKIKEGAVYIDGERVTDFQKEFAFDKPVVVKLGRRYARLVPGS